MQTFFVSDFGGFVLIRKMTKASPCSITLQTGIEKAQGKNIEKEIQEALLGELQNKQNFALICERKHQILQQEFDPYQDQIFHTQGVYDLMHEGLSDSVEYRRLMRKYLRPMKHKNIKDIYFLEALWGEEKTQKILRHLAGSQIRLHFLSDLIPEEKLNGIDVHVGLEDDPSFVRTRAEQILRQKLA